MSRTNAQLLGNVLVLKTRQQHDLRALCQPDAGPLGARQSHQLDLLIIRQLNRRRNS